VLLVLEDEHFSEGAVATAARLAARRRRGIHVFSLITVPMNLPIDAELEDEEGKARSRIERAKLIAGLRVTGHVQRVRPGQTGQAVVEEAREIDAAVIVAPLRYRNGAPLYGKMLQTVLAERPCRVVVVARPGDAEATETPQPRIPA
jgi:APA family basic amino acid/polyamine antiporter